MDAGRGLLSLVAVPKAFRGHVGVIQRNAIESWTRLRAAREVILFGDEPGVEAAARAVGVAHCPHLRRDAFGTPLFDDVLRLAHERGAADWVCYVNADIILSPEFGEAALTAIAALGPCLIVSRRWNLDVTDRLSFADGWEDDLRRRAERGAELFDASAIDVFVFPKGLFDAVPPFALGRSAWDNWMIAEARRRRCPVVDATAPYTVIHQNHSYDAFASMEDVRRGPQGLRNFWLAGDSPFLLGSLEDATHRVERGLVVPSGRGSVSVVITNAGSPEQVRGALQAVSGQRYPRTRIDVTVVDTTPTCSSASVRLEFPYVRVTRDTRAGVAAARNKGAAIADGELLAFLDSACRPERDWLDRAVAAVERAGARSIVVCGARPPGAIVVPRALWLEIGSFDERLPDAVRADADWLARAGARGIPIVRADGALVGVPAILQNVVRWRA